MEFIAEMCKCNLLTLNIMSPMKYSSPLKINTAVNFIPQKLRK